MNVTIGAFPTKLIISGARAASALPNMQKGYLRVAKDYVDWRSTSVTCKTIFSALLKCNLHDLIQRKIAYFGVWEPNLTAYISRTLKSGDTFVDVGANIGYYSLLAASLVGSNGGVIAIEASPVIFALLRENIELNNAKNVRIINCAAAYHAGEISLYAAPSDNIGKTSTIPQGGNSYSGVVQALPLQSILSQVEALHARIIKIDVEGAEPPILRSILENVDVYRGDCEIAAEIAPENSDMIALMREKGFNAYIVENDYSDAAYIRRKVRTPIRFDGLLSEQADFIFSRLDLPSL